MNNIKSQMILKHKIIFFFWKLKLLMFRIHVGANVRKESDNHPGMEVIGVVTGLTGVSVTDNMRDFRIQIQWNHLHDGNYTMPYHLDGAYSFDQFYYDEIEVI